MKAETGAGYRLLELMKTQRESVAGIMSLSYTEEGPWDFISLCSHTSVLDWEFVELVRMDHWVPPCKGSMGAVEITSLRLRLCKLGLGA